MIQKVDPSDSGMFVAANIARRAARLSSCRRRQVGAALFDMEAKLLATGYNKESEDVLGGRASCLEGDCPRGMAPYDVIPADSPYSDCIAVHAEMMALKKADLLPDATTIQGPLDLIMVVTHRPCHECTPVLEKLGLQVFYLEEM
jgi:deoxycytidylate deaminase